MALVDANIKSKLAYLLSTGFLDPKKQARLQQATRGLDLSGGPGAQIQSAGSPSAPMNYPLGGNNAEISQGPDRILGGSQAQIGSPNTLSSSQNFQNMIGGLDQNISDTRSKLEEAFARQNTLPSVAQQVQPVGQTSAGFDLTANVPETGIASAVGDSGLSNKINKPSSRKGGLFAGLEEGLTARRETGGDESTIPYALGRLPGDILRGKLGLETASEASKRKRELNQEDYKMEKEKRYVFQNRMEYLKEFGGAVPKETLDEMEKTLGFSISDQAEGGRATMELGLDGKPVYKFVPKEVWDLKVSQGKWDASEIEHMQKIAQEKTAWQGVKNQMIALGLTEEELGNSGNIIWETVGSPMGPLSVPARIDWVGQFSQDPRYAALRASIEQAFQAFRLRVTGAQASDKELARLRPVLPSLKDRPKVFWARIDALDNQAQESWDSRVNLYKRFGRDTSQIEGYLGGGRTAVPKTAEEKKAIAERIMKGQK